MDEPKSVQRRRRWSRRRRVACLAGLAVACLGLAPLAWRVWSAHVLSADLARLRSAGEPTTAADLPAEPLADADNGSLDYQAAGTMIDEGRPAWHAWDTDSSGAFRSPLSPAARATLRQIIADNAVALARVDVARGKAVGTWHDPIVQPTIYNSRQFNFKCERNLARLLDMAALSASAEGDFPAAVAHASDLCRLADAAERRPFLLGHLIANGIWLQAADAVEQIASDLRVGRDGGADRASVQRMINQLLDGRAAAAGDRFGWQTERILIVVSAGDAGRLDGAFQAIASHAYKDAAKRYLLAPIALIDADRLSLEMQRVIQAGQAPDLPTARSLMPTGLRATIDARPALHEFANGWIPNVKAFETAHRTTTERRLAALALGVRIYALGHGGRLPAKLDDLSPGEMAAVPVDPMSGRPFLYLPGGPDPRIYSVGPNGVDNGGYARDPRLILAQQKDIDDIVLHLDRRATPSTRPR
jgi:hypothetical protein